MPRPEPQLGKVPFKEALEHFRNKELVTTGSWDEMLGSHHARAFTIAGATQVDMLNDFKKAIEDIRARGGTITDFRKEFDAIVERYGWDYKGKRGWRTRVIFETNVKTSNAAGRWEKIAERQRNLREIDPEAQLYLSYTPLDRAPNRRPEHQAWRGITLPADHPWWNTHYPPNGYLCACSVRVFTEQDLKRRSIKVTENPPDLNPTERVNKRTGEIYQPTPSGIDVGFDHNHGKDLYFPSGANLVDDQLGSRLAKTVVDSQDFKSLFDGSAAGTALVGYLPDGLPDLLKTDTNRVFLTSGEIAKQRKAHTDLTITDFRRLPRVFRDALVLRDGRRIVFFLEAGKQVYRATIKSTHNGRDLRMTDFEKSSKREMKRARKDMKVIREPI